MTEAYVIRLKDDDVSDKLADNLISSSSKVKNDFDIVKYDAVTPDQVNELLSKHNVKWNYPWSAPQMDLLSGLLKTPYQTRDPNKRIACFLSHYLLWKQVSESEKGAFIFEHDAIFLKHIDVSMLEESPFHVIALNDPRGATRKSGEFHERTQEIKGDVVGIPQIDSHEIPQGLPGNSAYYIKPEGAQKLLRLVDAFGAWPNDAIMCRQLMPRQLGIVKKYCTTIQKAQSTTTT
jgi:GR25 family glycosyltransferase involved in LPS biosynthesis